MGRLALFLFLCYDGSSDFLWSQFFSVMIFAHIPDAFAHTVATFPQHEAIVFEDQRLVWRHVQQQVERLAQVFLAMGVQSGDRIGIMCTTRPEYIVTFLAAAQVGAILVGFNINYTVREISEQAAISQPAVMLLLHTHPRFAEVRRAVEAMPFVQHRIVINGAASVGWQEWQTLLDNAPPLLQALLQRGQEIRADDGVLMVFSGGISGEINGAVLSHRNIIANITAQNRILDWQASDRIILHLPMNHVSGATLLTMGAVLSGATLVMLERFRAERTLQLVQDEGVTIFGQVPAMWVMVFMVSNFNDYDLSSVRLTITSGAPTPNAIMHRIATLAPTTLHAYGLTEVAGMVTYHCANGGSVALLHSVGRIAPEFELSIRSDDRRPLPVGQVGEIAVRGDCVMLGYFRNLAATRQMIDEQGWLYTGDLGLLDDGGHLRLTGRKKRMFISGGYNVFPGEIESYVGQHPAVASCRCHYRRDDVMGEVGVLHVTPAVGAELTSAQIRAYCKQGLARYKVPRDVYVGAAREEERVQAWISSS